MYDICYQDFTNDYGKIYFKLKVYLKSNLINSTNIDSTKLYCNRINDIELHCKNRTETLRSYEIVHINCKCNLEVNEGR